MIIRPMYETPNDLQREATVKATLESLWEAQFHKMPKAYHIDWIITKNGQAKAFAELKCRNNERDKYPTLMLSLHKWMHGKEMAKEIGGTFLIIVQWTDGIFYYAQAEDDVTYGVGGRWDRGDSQDVEPVVFIPVEKFTQIGSAP